MLFKTVLVGLSLSSIVLAGNLSVSRNGKCGASTGYQCEGSKYGDCCSRYGYCGRTSAYCDAGCQDNFGSCWSDNQSTSKAAPSSTQTASSAAASSTLKVSTNARCGTGFGFTCLNSRYGDCCSQYSYCGSKSAYCGQGCQLGYGKCNESPKPTTTTIKSSSTASMTSSVTSSAASSPSSSSSATSTASTVSSSSISSITTAPPSSSSSSSSSTTSSSSSTAPAAPVASSVRIQVSGSGGGVLGFLGLTNDQSRYIVVSASAADLFTYNAPPASTTSGLTLVDTDAPPQHPFLAGLISPGIELQTSNSNAAILSSAPVSTSAGSTPQSGGSVAIPGSEYETSIFTINAITGSATTQWVNHDGSTPATSIVYDPVGQVIYLTANPSAVILNHPGSQVVTLRTI